MFGFSKQFFEKYKEMFGTELKGQSYMFGVIFNRSDENILKVFDKLGSDSSSGKHCKIDVIDVIPELIDYMKISKCDGNERVYIDYDYAFRELLDDIMQSGELTDDYIDKYNKLLHYKKTYRIKCN